MPSSYYEMKYLHGYGRNNVATFRQLLRYRTKTLRYAIKSNLYKLQRIRKGYSAYDVWNADRYLAGVLANILEDITKGHGVSSRFGGEIEQAVKDRDAEYFYHAAVLRKYANDEFEWHTNLDEFQATMDWVAANWMEFWD